MTKFKKLVESIVLKHLFRLKKDLIDQYPWNNLVLHTLKNTKKGYIDFPILYIKAYRVQSKEYKLKKNEG